MKKIRRRKINFFYKVARNIVEGYSSRPERIYLEDNSVVHFGKISKLTKYNDDLLSIKYVRRMIGDPISHCVTTSDGIESCQEISSSKQRFGSLYTIVPIGCDCYLVPDMHFKDNQSKNKKIPFVVYNNVGDLPAYISQESPYIWIEFNSKIKSDINGCDLLQRYGEPKIIETVPEKKKVEEKTEKLWSEHIIVWPKDGGGGMFVSKSKFDELDSETQRELEGMPSLKTRKEIKRLNNK